MKSTEAISERLKHTNWAAITSSFWYLTSTGMQRLASLILLSVLTLTLTPADFSRYGLFLSALQVFVALATLHIHMAPTRLAFDLKPGGQKLADLLKTAGAAALLGSLLALGVLVLGLQSTSWTDPLFQGELSAQLAFTLAIISLVLVQLASALLKIQRQALKLLVMLNVQSYSILIIYLIIHPHFEDKFLSLILSYGLGLSLAAALGLTSTGPYLFKGRLSKPHFKEAFVFTLPIGLQTMVLWAVQSAGRWIGVLYMDLTQLAPYMLVVQLVGIIHTINLALFDARVPDIGKCFASGDLRTGVTIINKTLLLSLGVISLAFAAIWFLFVFMGLQLPQGYTPSLSLIIIAFVICCLEALYVRALQIFTALKRTVLGAAATAVSAVITIALSFYLAPIWQDTGLILAGAIGIGTQALLSSFLARKVIIFSKST